MTALKARPYGTQAEDLDIDFNQPLRPQLETQLLSCCLQGADGNTLAPDFFWQMGVSQRIAKLLNIVALSEGSCFDFMLSCPQETCQETMSIEIDFDSLYRLQQAAYEETAVVLKKHALCVRRPTGQDQLNWLTQPDSEKGLQTMLQALLVSPDVNPDINLIQVSQPETTDEQLSLALPALNQALDQLDPLVNFTLSVTCPHCDRTTQSDLDLGAWALEKLRRSQQQLISMVHRLAYHYHWSELEIFAIPNWRRAHYLALIEREVIR